MLVFENYFSKYNMSALTGGRLVCGVYCLYCHWYVVSLQRYGVAECGQTGKERGEREEEEEEEEQLYVVSRNRLVTPVEMVGADKVTRKQRSATPSTVPVSGPLCSAMCCLPGMNFSCLGDALKTRLNTVAGEIVAKCDYVLACGPEHCFHWYSSGRPKRSAAVLVLPLWKSVV